jgi:hypothetical protein
VDIPLINNTLSSVTRILTTHTGYTVGTVTHTESMGKIESVKTEYTVYDRSAQIERDPTPRYGHTVDVTV